MNKKVKVYSMKKSEECKEAKKYLNTNNISYKEIDITKDVEKTKEAFRKSRQMGLPVIDIDGTIVTGFDREALARALAGKKA